MKTFDTKIYTPYDNLIGLDLEVYNIQTQLARISWLEAVFGLAYIQNRQKSEAEAISMQNAGFRGSMKYNQTYPQGFKSYKIDEDLSFNDSYASRGFFLQRDSADINMPVDKWNWVNNNIGIKQPLSFIFHCNLDSLEIQAKEQVKTDILYIFNKLPKVIGLNMEENMENIWKEFTITPEMNGITRYPFYCFRLDFVLDYLAFPYNNNNSGYNPNIP